MQNMTKIIFACLIGLITISSSFGQSITQIEYKETVHCRSSIPMSDLGYSWSNEPLPPQYEMVQNLYFQINDTKIDSIIVELPVFEDSLVMVRIMPITVGIELQLYDADMKKLGCNYVSTNDKYYDGIAGKGSQKYFLGLKIREPLSEKFKGRILRVVIGKRTYEKPNEPTTKTSKIKKRKRGKKR